MSTFAPLAIVSGATGTIGRVVVERLWHDGYSILALGRTPAKLEALQQWLTVTPHHNAQVSYVVAMNFHDADYTRLAAYYACHRRQDGQIALLVLCHGAAPEVMPVLSPPAPGAVDTVWQTDVRATIALCQSVGVPMTAQRQGVIVLVSSLHAKVSYPQRLAYAVAKSALSGLVRSLALEWGALGVRTNALLPWQVTGERTTRFIAAHRETTGEDLEELYKQRSPSRRLVTPADVAAAVLFCANNPALNGAEIVLDGGVSQSMWYGPFREPEYATEE